MKLNKRDYDAVVVGSGPNGLAAAITMQQAGLSVLIIEGEDTIGGGIRSSELTLPHFIHDVCSAIHPLAVSSPFFKKLPLEKHGLEFIYPPIQAAHPFDNGSAAVLLKSVDETAQHLGIDKEVYLKLLGPIVEEWPLLLPEILCPLHFPKHPLVMARFGLKAITSALHFARHFKTTEAKGLWAGMSAHSIQSLSNPATSAFALVLMATGHTYGWPMPKGGSQSIAN